MPTEQIRNFAPLILGGIFGLGILLMLASVRAFRKSRSDYFWRKRRAAGQRGWRLFVVAFATLVLSGVLCVAMGINGLIFTHPTPTAVAVIPTNTATATITATQTPTFTNTATNTAAITNTVMTNTAAATQNPAATATSTLTFTLQPDTPTNTVTPLTVGIQTQEAVAFSTLESTNTPTITDSPTLTATITTSPTETLSATPTLTFTPSLTPTITPTPTATFIVLISTQDVESSVTPAANAGLKITALDTQITASCAPVNPSDTFSAGFKRIYFFVNYTGMQNGVLWRRELLYTDQIIQHVEYLWGSTALDGTACFFFGQESGFQTGSYQIRLYIGSNTTPAATASFTVK